MNRFHTFGRKVGLTATALATGIALAITATPVAAEEIIKIGQIEAQTGPFASYGYMYVQGARLAADEINRAGGFKVGDKTYKFELIAPDTRGDPKEGVVQIKKLLEHDKVRFILGPSTSNVFSTVLPYAKRMDGKFLMITTSSRAHESLGKPGYDFLLRSWNWVDGPKGSGTMLTKYMREKLNPKKMGLLLPNHEGGRVTHEILAGLFKSVDLPFVVEFYDPATKDFTPLLGKLKEQGADVLVTPPGSDEAALTDVVRQASEGNYFRRFVPYNGGTLNPGLRNKEILDDYIFDTAKYFQQAEETDPKIKKFVNDYKAFHKEEFPYSQAPTCAGGCYDTLYMLIEAMKTAGSVDDMPAIRKALLSMKYDGLWKYVFDEKGEAMFDFDIVHLKRGGGITVEKVKVVE
jgi:branched-chain amino acid transport system substrate-binding protein